MTGSLAQVAAAAGAFVGRSVSRDPSGSLSALSRRGNFLLWAVTAMLVSACSDRPNPVPKVVKVDNLAFRFHEANEISYLPTKPRYLRAAVNSDVDVVIDERLLDSKVPGYMSVLPVAFGMGTRHVLGKYKVACSGEQSLLYDCGIKDMFKGAPIVLLFAAQPRSEQAIDQLREQTVRFLETRLDT